MTTTMEAILKLQECNDSIGKFAYQVKGEDVEKTEYLRHVIENTRDEKSPVPGDIIICKGPDKTYLNGHMDAPIGQYGSICVEPYTPSVDIAYNGNDITYSTSGGYWFSEGEVEMFVKEEGTRLKKFWTWGHCGPCAGGGIYFEARVNVWSIFKESIY